MAHWILVDYENVRPSDFHPERQPDTRILVFLGPNQQKIPADLVMALQAFGPDARYVQCSAAGRNALDFHIAFYLGDLAPRHPGDQFHIVSEDKGFDPLVRHMRAERGIAVQRHAALPAIPGRARAAAKRKSSRAGTASPTAEDVRKALAAAGASRPRKVNTLRNWIGTRFNGRLDEADLDRLVANLRSRRLIAVSGDKVTYKL